MKEGELRNKRIDKSKKKGYIKYPFYSYFTASSAVTLK